MSENRIINADALTGLRTLPDGIAQTCVTSPPYYCQRDYKTDGQIGLEASPEEYVARLVEVFGEVRRVLRDDGTLWVVIGDSYAGGSGGRRDKERTYIRANGYVDHFTQKEIGDRVMRNAKGCKPKDLIGIPWMFAFAMRADGWCLRQEIIWAKPNGMPEPVKDRCTRAHETIFMFAKSRRYYYDSAAIAEPAVSKSLRKFIDSRGDKQRGHTRKHSGFNGRYAKKLAETGVPTTRNRRDVWTVATDSYRGAHFAVYPPRLILPCILAGSRPGDVVLDPFLGSGTTAVVADMTGRRYIGIEISPEYCTLARKRVHGTQMQLDLGGVAS